MINKKKKIFSETTLQEDVLIVYFYTDGVTSMHREIKKVIL